MRQRERERERANQVSKTVTLSRKVVLNQLLLDRNKNIFDHKHQTRLGTACRGCKTTLGCRVGRKNVDWSIVSASSDFKYDR